MFHTFPGMTWNQPHRPLLVPDHTLETAERGLPPHRSPPLPTASGNISARRRKDGITCFVLSLPLSLFLPLIVCTHTVALAAVCVCAEWEGIIPFRTQSRLVLLRCARSLSLSSSPSLSSPQYNIPVFKRDDSRGERVSGSHRCVAANSQTRTHTHTHTYTPGNYHVTLHLGVEKVPDIVTRDSFVEELAGSPFQQELTNRSTK